MKVNGREFVSPQDGTWTVSAAALYLLRTFSSDHGEGLTVADQNYLFPCCGFNAWKLPEDERVVCIGCPNGLDVEVIHKNGSLVELRKRDVVECVSVDMWTRAVLGFAMQIRQFYQDSRRKAYIADDFDRSGWDAFWKEWSELEASATASLNVY
ncbi:hypothetical protein [Paraburkholderia sabiae]|uniref:hypothetical protein n=1 Tax=Paraburkholderia sabiae TaxID=273251 RepID=UPI001CC775ED|nr:hypothetical protein [Paraburkholderia sabiae]